MNLQAAAQCAGQCRTAEINRSIHELVFCNRADRPESLVGEADEELFGMVGDTPQITLAVAKHRAFAVRAEALMGGILLAGFRVKRGGVFGGQKRQQGGKQSARTGIWHHKAVIFPAFGADRLTRYRRPQCISLDKADAV